MAKYLASLCQWQARKDGSGSIFLGVGPVDIVDDWMDAHFDHRQQCKDGWGNELSVVIELVSGGEPKFCSVQGHIPGEMLTDVWELHQQLVAVRNRMIAMAMLDLVERLEKAEVS